MPPVPGGRMCQQCAKRIVDFTRMSPAEIATVHRQSDVPVCGMYRDGQLQMPQRIAQKAVGRGSTTAAFSLVSMLLLEPTGASAQAPATEHVAPVEDPAARPAGSAPASALRKGPVVVKGTVTDMGEPVPFVPVFVRDTEIGTTTDFDGRFALDLTELAVTRQKVMLVMQYIGHTDLELEVDLEDPTDVAFRVEEGTVDLTAFSVTYKKPPLHKRIWRGIIRPFQSK